LNFKIIYRASVDFIISKTKEAWEEYGTQLLALYHALQHSVLLLVELIPLQFKRSFSLEGENVMKSQWIVKC